MKSLKIIHQFKLSKHFSTQGCYLVDKLPSKGGSGKLTCFLTPFHLDDDLCKASTGIGKKTVKYEELWKYEISTELLLREFN
jgi:hypothetical protein